MRANTEKALAWIGLSEGGYVNHPDDPGGATDRGITQRTFDAWNRSQGRPARPVRGISKFEAEAIIVSQYFQPVRFDDLPSGLDYAVADWSVNSGPSRAAKELQRIVGVAQDGVIGQQTLAAVARGSTTQIINAYCDRRMSFLRSLKTWGTFGRGWSSRVQAVRERSIDMAMGADRPDTSTVPRTPKAPDADRAESAWIKKALEEPAVWIPAAGGVLSGLTDGDGPMQWALAAVIVVGAVYAATRLLKKAGA
ncbi:glycoside hydrolase family 108 protein [Paracoccus homiensis]|uniref:Lysozyme family protein n=1 Tax=Paracoccus homiensis TaxID=364199 RepID=A0A1I0GWL0_9RHOB|nr:glycoside hydrolase family 108 protein [Paracoccus homiensis]SET74711.1 Lysozyme family protein [Paracoccus homiensis]